MGKRVASAVGMALTLLTFPAVSGAASIGMDPESVDLIYRAEPGEQNEVIMSAEPSQGTWYFNVKDNGPLTIGKRCEATETGAVCTFSSPGEVGVSLGDGDDSFDGTKLGDGTSRRTPELFVNGDSGRDQISAMTAHAAIDGDDGADRITLAPYVSFSGQVSVEGDAGADRIIGTNVKDWIIGGSGNDSIEGRGGDDDLHGGADGDAIRGGDGRDFLMPGHGDDEVEGGRGEDSLHVEYEPPPRKDGADNLDGGPGDDSAHYLCGGCRLSLDGKSNDGIPGENDDLLDFEQVKIRSVVTQGLGSYGPGHDVLEGGRADEVLVTKRGNDRVIGGRGEDDLDAGLGDDELLAADGEADRVGCGPGRDVASVDQFDDVRSCEIVNETIFNRGAPAEGA